MGFYLNKMCLNFEQLKDQIILKKLEDTMTTEKVKKQDIDLCNKMVNSENDLSIIRGCESLKKTTQHTTDSTLEKNSTNPIVEDLSDAFLTADSTNFGCTTQKGESVEISNVYDSPTSLETSETKNPSRTNCNSSKISNKSCNLQQQEDNPKLRKISGLEAKQENKQQYNVLGI